MSFLTDCLRVAAVLAAAPSLMLLLQALVGRLGRLRSAPAPAGPGPALVVVVPAHDEAAVIEVAVRRLLDAIAADGVRARVLVVADNCTDDTARLARAAGAVVRERNDPQLRGKGHALAFAVASLSDEEWDGVVVIDADARPLPGYLAAVSAEIAAGTPAMQGFGSVDDGGDARTAMSRLAFALINAARPLGRYLLGGSSQISGNGFALSRSCLERVPLVPTSALAEDLEHGLALVCAGIRVKPLLHARLVAMPPPDGKAATSQRTRWEAGRLQALVRWFPRLIAHGSWASWEAACDLLVPPLAMLVLAQSVIAVIALLMVDMPALAIAGGALLLPLIALIAAVQVAGLPLGSLLALRHVPLFLFWKASVYLSPRFWRQRAWVRTARQAIPVLLAGLALAGCGRTPPPAPLALPPPPVSHLPRNAPSPSDPVLFPRSCRERFARLQPGDVIRLRIEGDPRYRDGVERSVDPLGRVPVPLAGPLPAEGLLPEEFAAKVAAALAPWITSPRCDVELLRPEDRQALVIGAVNQQGPVKLRPDDTLLALLARATGVRESKSALNGRSLPPREARIIRDRSAVAIIDLESLLRDGAPAADIAIAPGDLVQVPDPAVHTILVLGEVGRQGPVTLEDGMDLMQVLALAGGMTEDAAPADGRLVRGWWRSEGAEVHELDLAASLEGAGAALPALQDRDVLVVPRRGLATFGYYMRQISPGIVTFATIQAVAGITQGNK